MQKVKRRSNARKLNKDAGFSLLELLIAVVILAIIVIPLLNLFLSSNRLNIKSRQTLRATTAAQDIMEGLKAYNLEEIQAQFADPASGFYVIDSRMIKGGVDEEDTLEVDGTNAHADGLYVFSMKELNMQGSKFDAKITLDGRGYMDPSLFPCGGGSPHMYSPTFFSGEKCTMCGAFKDPARIHDGVFNDAAMADARSIDKNNGTFVETAKIRQAVLDSVFDNSAVKSDIEARLKAEGIADADLDAKYKEKKAAVHYKNLATFFEHASREIEVELKRNDTNLDKDGRPTVDMKVTQTYTFHYKPLSGANVEIKTKGDMGSGVMVSDLPCGSVTQTKDNKINVNLFYYPLYNASVPDKIIIDNQSGVDLNLLIAKQRYEKEKEDPSNPGHMVPDSSDPEYLPDPQLMAAEQSYIAEIEIKDTHFDAEKFSLKTNLGLNLVGDKYMTGVSMELPAQFSVKGKNLNQLNLFTLDGVRSPLGKAGTTGEITELIYDVEVSVYEEGAAASGFPDDKRMIVIEGSTTN